VKPSGQIVPIFSFFLDIQLGIGQNLSKKVRIVY
jgi:hypothetical protein